VTDYGLTPTGFVAKPYADVLADIVGRQRTTIDPGLDTSPDSVIGQLNGIIASQIRELWEVAQGLYDALDPDAVTGAQQDALYSLTNTLRKSASKSRVTATVNLAASTSIAIGDAVASVAGNPTARFVNVEPMVNEEGTPEDVEVVFEAETAGVVVANAGTLTVRETFVSGWNSITNVLDAELGADFESDAAYRIRRVLELASVGGGTVNGIRADLLKLEDVSAVVVLENDTDYTDLATGLPPHSIEAVVQGGEDPAAIAASIYGNKPSGTQTVGNQTAEVVTDDQGFEHDVYFSRPTLVPVYIALEVETGEGYDVETLQQTIEDSTTSQTDPGYLTVGTDVYAGRIVATAMGVAGVLNARAGLSLSTITDPDDGDVSLAVDVRSVATVVVDNIVVTVL
jgi:uncharacterized phage protein gp47/JayE